MLARWWIYYYYCGWSFVVKAVNFVKKALRLTASEEKCRMSMAWGRQRASKLAWPQQHSNCRAENTVSCQALHDQSHMAVFKLCSSFHCYPCCLQIGKIACQPKSKRLTYDSMNNPMYTTKNVCTEVFQLTCCKKAQTPHNHALLLRLWTKQENDIWLVMLTTVAYT